jgi:hypothetical protein
MKKRCPVCHKVVKASVQEKTEETRFFPFCSERCRLIDLGGWLDGRYKIISESQSQEPDEPPGISGPISQK